MSDLASGPMVSIIVPVYNSERYLTACVASILDQDYRNIEILLIDDGSTDSSGGICDRFAAQDDRVVVVHRENGGIAAAQNSGLDAAAGELITFCDNDDLMSGRMVGRLVEILLATGADMSCCRWQNVGASGASALLDSAEDQRVGQFIAFDDPGRHYQGVFSLLLRRLTRAELYYFSEANWGKLYRRALFDDIRFPENRYAQDVAVAMDLYQRIRLVASCEDRLYYWLQHADSVSHTLRTAAYYHDIVRAHGRCFEISVENGILPARAYFGLKAIRSQKASAKTAADRAILDDDLRYVSSLLSSLSTRQRVHCTLLHWLRRLEVYVYDRTVHRRS